MAPSADAKRPRSPRIRRKRRQARDDILTVAREILSEQGVDAVTLAAVGGELGMTKQALYHYFPSKEALMKALVTSLIDDEIESLLAGIAATGSRADVLGTLIRGFYAHYRGNLNAFRTVYCQSQLYSAPDTGMDRETVRKEVNPRTQRLFDALEDRLAGAAASRRERERMRQLAFGAWTAALGLLTMLSVTDAVGDPLIHKDEDLLRTLAAVFDQAVT